MNESIRIDGFQEAARGSCPSDDDYYPLEERILFDGAAAAEAADDLQDNYGEDAGADVIATQQAQEQAAEALASAVTEMSEFHGNEIYFVDAGIQDVDGVISGIPDGVELVMIDANTDGVEQIAAVLAGRDDIEAIHILSHGQAGELHLGNASLNAASIGGTYADELSVIGAALSENADILIYGCDFGQDEAILVALSDATGADVAASLDATGHEGLGGDWDLEAQSGVIEASSFSAEQWRGLLGPGIFVLDSNGADDWNNPERADITAINVDYSQVPSGTLTASLQLDAVSDPSGGVSGGLLFDTDGDGNANVIVMVTLEPDSVTGDYIITEFTFNEGRNDSRPDKVSGNVTTTIPTNSTAVLSIATNPYDATDQDSLITFTIDLDELGGVPAGTVLLNGVTTASPSATSDIKDILLDPGVAPAAEDDTASVDQDDSVIVNVVENDVAAGVDTIVVGDGSNGLLQPSNGTVVANADGTVTYTPAAGFSGPDTFEYQVTGLDGQQYTATVSVTVNPVINVNDAPVATASTSSGGEDSDIPVALAGTDVDGTIAAVTVTTLPPASEGVLYLADGTTPVVAGTALTPAQAAGLIFTPAADFNGDVTIAFTVTDDDGATSAAANEVITITDVNDAPVATASTSSGGEDSDIPVALAGTDVDGTIAAVTVTTLPPASEGVLYLADGTTPVVAGTALTPAQAAGLIFTPAADFNGDVTIAFTVTDDDGATSAAANEVITITDVNDAPVATASTSSGGEDSDIPVALAGTDVDGTIAAVTVTTLPPASEGVLYLADGTTPVVAGTALTPAQAAGLIFTPAADFNGDVTIAFTVTDDDGATSAAANEVITITDVNDAPVATASTSSGGEDSDIPVALAGTDVDGTIAAVTVTTLPPASEGVLYLADGTTPVVAGTALTPAQAAGLIFTPAADFNGDVTIAFTVTDDDGATSAAANEVITITDVNDAPVATASTSSGGEDSDIPVALAGTDVDGTIAAVTVTTLPPASEGVLYLADGTTPVVAGTALTPAQAAGLIFTPAADFNGDVTIAFTVTDDDGATSAAANEVITITDVNDAPVATASTSSGGEDSDIPVALAGTDVDGTIAAVTVTTLPPASEGVLYLADGTTPVVAGTALTPAQAAGLIFTPAADFNGDVTIAFTVTDDDGATSAAANEVITITDVNDAPVATASTSSGGEDSDIPVALAGTDVDGTIAAVTVTTLPPASEGVLYLADGTTPVVAGTALTPAQAAGLIFTPAADFNGDVTIAFTVTDDDGATSAAANEVITITDVNDAPVATASTSSGGEDSDIPVALAGTDVDGTIAAVTVTTLPPASEGVLYLADGTTPVVAGTALTPAQAAGLIFTPAADFNGDVTIAFTVTDDDGATSAAANEVITITDVNDAPVATASTSSGGEDSDIPVALAGTDVDGTIAAVTVTTLPPASEGVLYLADGTTPVVAGTALTPAQAAGLIFTPAADFNGDVTIAFTVTDDDGATSAAANEVITITDVNDAPVATASTSSGGEDSDIPVALAGTDVDGTIAAVTVTTLPPASEGVLYLADGTTPVVAGTALTPAQAAGLIFTPAADFNGDVTIAFTVTDDDGATSAAANEVITITDVNDAPVATASTSSGGEDSDIPVALAGTDVDGTIAAVTVTTLPPASEGVLYLADGTTPVVAGTALTPAQAAGLIFTPAADFNGDVTIAFTVTDDDGATSAAANEVITITDVNDAPVAVADRVIIAEDTPASGSLLGNDSDPDGDALEVTQVLVDIDGDGTADVLPLGTPTALSSASGDPIGTLIVSPDGSFTFTPAPNYDGPVPQVGYTISDGAGGSATSTLDITITPVDDLLVITGLTDGVVAGTDGTAEESDLADGTTPGEDGETVSGSFTVSVADGITTLSVNGTTLSAAQLAALTPTAPAVIATPLGTLELTGFDPVTGVIDYVYTLGDVADHSVGAVTDDIALELSDGDDDTTTGTLSIAVLDDTPTAADDTDEAISTPGNPSSVAQGNVVTGVDTSAEPNTTDGVADVIGADGAAAGGPVTGVVFGTGVPVAGNVGGLVAGDHGTLVLSADGSYTYTPDYTDPAVSALGAGDVLTEVFTYEITDGDGDVATATLTISISGTPAILGLGDGTVPGTDGVVLESDLADGTNAAGTGDVLTGTFQVIAPEGVISVTFGGTTLSAAQLAALTPTAPAVIATPLGTLELTGFDPVTGVIDYVYTLGDDVDHSGGAVTDAVAVSVTDALGDTGTGTLSIAVLDDAPTAADDTASLGEDDVAPVTGNVVTGNDVLGADETATPVTGVVAGAGVPVGNVGTGVAGSYGTLTIGADGSYAYVLDTTDPVVQGLQVGETLSDVFTYQITDSDGDTATATLTMTVTGSNDAPVAVADRVIIAEDTPASGSLLGNDSDPDGDALEVTQVLVDIDGDGTADVLPLGTPTALSSASGDPIGTLIVSPDGSFTFTPAPNYDGPVPQVGYTISDGAGGSATSTLDITITPVDDLLVITGLTDGVVAGTDGTAEESDLADGTTPGEDGETVSGSFTVSVADGITTLSVNGTTLSAAQLAALTPTAPAVIATPLGTLELTGFDPVTGVIDYVYTLGDVADHSVGAVTDDIALELSDGDDDTTTGTLSIAVLDDTPTAADDTDEAISTPGNPSSVAQGNVVTGVDTSAEPNTTDGVADVIGADGAAAGGPVTGVVFGTGVPVAGNVGGLVAGDHGTLVLSADGSYTYTPDYTDPAVSALGAGDVLTEVFTYEITDGDGDVATATLTISISGTPAILGLGDGTVPGTDGVVLESDLADGTNAAGTGDVLTGTFQVIAPEGVISVTFGGTTLSAAQLAALTPTAPAVIATPLGTLELTGFDPVTGVIDYVYTLGDDVDHSGGAVTDAVAVSVTDALGDTGTGTLSIAVLDDAPTAADDTASLGEDDVAPVTGNVVTGNDVLGADETATPVTGVVAGAGVPVGNVGTGVAGSYGTLTIGADGSYAYVLDTTDPVVQGLQVGETLSDVFTYQITDSDGDTATATLTMTVTGSNDAPVAVADRVIIAEDTPASGSLLGNDSDPDGDALEVTQVLVDIDGDGTADVLPLGTPTALSSASGDPIGTLIVSPDGSFTFTPAPNYDGPVPQVGYTISDGAGGSATSTLDITITPVDDLLVITGLTDGVVAGTDGTAEESDLADGTTPGEDGETVSGSFTVSVADGITTLSVNGTTLSAAQLAALTPTAPAVIATPLGTLELTGFDPVTGVIDYVYTLGDVADHSVGAVTDDIALELSDGDDDTTTGTLSIAVLDDTPTAADDTDEAISTPGNPSSVAQGNVVTGVDTSAEPNTTDGVADVIGADGAAAGGPVTGVVFGTGVPVAGNVGGLVAGDHGTLVLSADGSYTYTPDYTDPAVSALGAGDVLTEVFTYEITDGDGDVATATLTISISGTPAILGLGDGTVPGTDGVVLESDLADGTNAAGTGDVLTGTFQVIAPEGVISVTFGGTTLSAAQLAALTPTAPAVIATPLGTLELTGFDPVTGVIDYVYTLGDDVDHSGGAVTDAVAVSVTDALGDTGTGTLSIAVLDDAPTAADDTASLGEDDVAPVTGNVVTGNDVLGADETATPVTGVVAGAGVPVGNVGTGVAGSYGTLTIGADGSYAYVLDTTDPVVQGLQVGETLSDVFTYQITDSDGDTATATLTMTVTGSNDAPVAVADRVIIAEDTPASGSLLGNDSDPDGDALEVTQVLVDIDGDGTADVLPLGTPTALSSASGDPIGTLIVSPDGSFTFTPAPNYDGPVPQVGYTISDGAGGSATSTLDITITPVDDLLVITGLTDGVVAGTDGTAEESDLADGTTPGEDGETVSGSFTVSVADGITTLSVNGTTLSAAQLAALTPTAPAVIATPLGTLELTGFDPVTGVIDYVYTLGDVADHSVGAVTDDIALELSDGDDDTTTGTLSIAVLDDTPTAADDTDEAISTPGNPSSVAQGNVVTGVDTSAEPNTTDGVADVIGADGAAAGGPVTGVVFGTGVPVAGNVGGLVAGDHGTLVLSADGSYTYTPDYTDPAVSALGAGDVLTEVFTYEITDGDGDVATATLTISISGTPAILGLGDGTVPGTDGVVLESDLADGTNAAGTGDVLTGTFQVIAPEGVISVTFGGTTLSAAQLAALTPTAPAVIATPLGTLELTGFDPVTGVIDYVYTLGDDVDHSGGAVTDAVAVSVTDALGDTGTGTLSIAVLDDAPTAADDTDEAISTPGNPSSVAQGNVVTGVDTSAEPNTTDGVADVIGADGAAAGGPVTGVVFGTGVPVAGNFGGLVAGDHGTLVLSADGSYTYTPDYTDPAVSALGAGDVLTEVFTYEITDGDGDVATATLTISISGTPAILGLGDGTVPGTDGVVLESDLADGTNAAGTGDVLTGTFQVIAPEGVISVTFGGTTLSAAQLAALTPTAPAVIATPLGTLELTGFDPVTGVIDYVYTLGDDVDHSGGAVTDAVAVSVTDALGDTGTGTLSIAVLDDAPTAADDTASLGEDDVAPVTGNVVTGNDVLGADETATPVTGVVAGAGVPVGNVGTGVAGSYGTLTIGADGSYAYVLDTTDPVVQGLQVGETLSDVFTYQITDSDGDTATATLTMTVTGSNDAPVATASTSSGDEDSDIPVALAGTDVDGTIAAVTVTTLPPASEGVLYLADGTTPVVAGTALTPAQAAGLIFTPAADFNGDVTIAFTVTDDDGATSAAANEVITITDVNDAPVAVADRVIVAEDTPARYDLPPQEYEPIIVDHIVDETANSVGSLYSITPLLSGMNTDLGVEHPILTALNSLQELDGTMQLSTTRGDVFAGIDADGPILQAVKDVGFKPLVDQHDPFGQSFPKSAADIDAVMTRSGFLIQLTVLEDNEAPALLVQVWSLTGEVEQVRNVAYETEGGEIIDAMSAVLVANAEGQIQANIELETGHAIKLDVSLSSEAGYNAVAKLDEVGMTTFSDQTERIAQSNDYETARLMHAIRGSQG